MFAKKSSSTKEGEPIAYGESTEYYSKRTARIFYQHR